MKTSAQSCPINDAQLLEAVGALARSRSMQRLREKCDQLSAKLQRSEQAEWAGGATADYLSQELNQIAESRTLERAKYYAQRLQKSLTEQKLAPNSDLDLNRWKLYHDIQTGSLWQFETRERGSGHTAEYWGNFIPQIPNQLMRRFTREGDWVIDGFAGSGTTLIEAGLLGRNCFGVELQAERAKKTRDLIRKEVKNAATELIVRTGDSSTYDFSSGLKRVGAQSAQLVILHPPYHDIIRFSEDDEDLSNAPDTKSFVDQMCAVVRQSTAPLESGRHLAIVIGDKYADGEWVPLGFLTMNAVQDMGFKLKSIIVKNFDKTAGKRGQEELWQYRALAGGFYVFKHEYVFLFQKR